MDPEGSARNSNSWLLYARLADQQPAGMLCLAVTAIACTSAVYAN